MKTKTVYFSQVTTKGDRTFEDILLDSRLCVPIPIHNKMVEISYVQDEEHFITAVFVVTQITDIPPTHKPGEEDDYSAIPLEPGKGFAYPSVVLYLKEEKVLLWENNRLAVAESTMTSYFNSISERHGLSKYKVELTTLLNFDPVKRVNNLLRVNAVELKVVEPTAYLRNETGANGAIGDIAQAVNKVNPTKLVTIKFEADKTQASGLSKKSVLDIVKAFSRLVHITKGNSYDKLIIAGISGDEDNPIEDTINFMTNRIKGEFKIKKTAIAENLQVDERKKGIRNIAVGRIKEIRLIINGS